MRQTIAIFWSVLALPLAAQQPDTLRTDQQLDSLYISEVEDVRGRDKVLHAEPLYIDLIRDLGARKGEREWNMGLGITDNLGYDAYTFLVEYEWAPVDRLGLEVELPFVFHGNQSSSESVLRPPDRLESFKMAAQWSFFVNERISTSMALGYINELVFSDLDRFGDPMITGNIYNPFLVVAKRWGRNLHTLVYTGPHVYQDLVDGGSHLRYDINSNLHFMIAGTRNFIGIEANKSVEDGDFDMTLRPQMRVSVADNFLVGIVTGIPVERENERFSMFLRLIWEPGNRHGKH